MKRRPGKLFPRTHKALTLEGFVFVRAGTCADCGASVQWYLTPRQKRMPIDAAKHVPHFWCCPAFAKGTVGRGAQLELFAPAG
jgi:hypothetical protein